MPWLTGGAPSSAAGTGRTRVGVEVSPQGCVWAPGAVIRSMRGVARQRDGDILAQPREDSGDMGWNSRKPREKPPHASRYPSFPA